MPASLLDSQLETLEPLGSERARVRRSTRRMPEQAVARVLDAATHSKRPAQPHRALSGPPGRELCGRAEGSRPRPVCSSVGLRRGIAHCRVRDRRGAPSPGSAVDRRPIERAGCGPGGTAWPRRSLPSVASRFGKGAARKLRAAGRIPAVIYGHGTEPVHISLPGHETALIIRKANAVLELDFAGAPQLALVKDVQKDPVKQIIEHIDLLLVRSGEKVQVEVPVHLEGESAPGTIATLDAQTLLLEVRPRTSRSASIGRSRA